MAYFDQLRAQLDPDKSAVENVADGHDTVVLLPLTAAPATCSVTCTISCFREIGPAAWCVTCGRRAEPAPSGPHVHPAGQFAGAGRADSLTTSTPRRSNCLKPCWWTSLGTLLLAVSHDRAFLNNVATSTLVFEGEGRFKEYVGGYDDWVRPACVEVGFRFPEVSAKGEGPIPKRERGGGSSVTKRSASWMACPSGLSCWRLSKPNCTSRLPSRPFIASLDPRSRS